MTAPLRLAEQLIRRAEHYGAEVPAWVRFLTLGGDLQSGAEPHIEASVYGWGFGLGSALIGHFVLAGDPADAAVWARLDALLLRTFRSADGRDLVVQAAAIAWGGRHGDGTVAFCSGRATRRVWAIRRRSEPHGARSPVWPRSRVDVRDGGYHLIGGNAARDWAYGSLAVERPGPRHVHVPREAAAGSRPIDEGFFDELTREYRVLRPEGHTEWVLTGPCVAGTCWVNASVALCGLQAQHALFLEVGRASPEPDGAEAADALDRPARDPSFGRDIPASAHVPASFRPAYWHGLTSFDRRSGMAALSFQCFDGEVVRLQLNQHDLGHVHAVTGDLLAQRPGSRVHSEGSSADPLSSSTRQDAAATPSADAAPSILSDDLFGRHAAWRRRVAAMLRRGVVTVARDVIAGVSPASTGRPADVRTAASPPAGTAGAGGTPAGPGGVP